MPDRSDLRVSKKPVSPSKLGSVVVNHPKSGPSPAKRDIRKTASVPRRKTRAKKGVKDTRKSRAKDYLVDEPQARYAIAPGQLAMPFLPTAAVSRTEPHPFLKWAGGKASLLSQLAALFPSQMDRYFEPFLGGGAVFFHLKHRFPHLRAFLRDSNRELINSYRAVRDRPDELMLLLDGHANRFRAEGDPYYYVVRDQHDLSDDLARAARTIFLNKTCYNGLWRVNARGEFNTPVGSNKNPNLYDRANLLAASAALQDAQLEAQDFRVVVTEVRRGDFIYFDPPYLPVSTYSDFKRYTPDQFRDAEQEELARIVRELDAKGCEFALSNSDHPRIRELYAGLTFSVVSARDVLTA